MATDLEPKAKRLVAEFQTKLGLNDVDARRAAFIVLAIGNGWRKSRIARFLGVHRQRVGQKVARYQEYAESGKWPEVKKLLTKPLPTEPENGSRQLEFTKSEWESLDFANDLLNRLCTRFGKN